MTLILMTLSFVGGYAFCRKQDAILSFIKSKVEAWRAR